MLRRTIFMAAAAAALVLAPTAALAYDAPGYSSSVSDSTPVVGAAVTVTVTGVAPGAVVTFKFSDGQVLTATADSNGVAVVSVTFASAGTFTLQAFVDGNLVSDQVLTVSAAAVASAGGAAGAESMPVTGFDGVGLALGAGALVLAGAGAVVYVKRRQVSHTSS